MDDEEGGAKRGGKPKLHEYDGRSDLSKWIFQASFALKEVEDWSEARKVSLLVQALTGAALAYVSGSVGEEHDQLDTVETVFDLLRKGFNPRVAKSTVRARLRALRMQGNDLDSFYEKFLEIVSQAQFTDTSEVIQLYIDGLASQRRLQEALHMRVEEDSELLEIHEIAVKWMGRNAASYGSADDRTDRDHGRRHGGPKKEWRKHSGGQDKGQEKEKSEKETRTCHNCGKVGHIKKNCRAPPREAQAKKMDDPETPRGMYVPVCVAGKEPIRALVDSGASNCVISKKLCVERGLKVTTSATGTMTLASGAKVVSVQRTEPLEIAVGTIKAMLPLFVIDELDDPMLLGLDFFLKTGAVIDPANKRIVVSTPLINASEATMSEAIMKSIKFAMEGEEGVSEETELLDTVHEDDKEICVLAEEPVGQVTPEGALGATILEEFGDVFATRGILDLRRAADTGSKAAIKLKRGTTPIYVRNYRQSFHHDREMPSEILEMLEAGIIRESKSPWNAPILILDQAGKKRIVIDYRRLNEVIEDDGGYIPLIDELFDQLAGATMFSKMDFSKGFWQIDLDEDSKPCTAFTVGQRHFEFNRLPMGLKTAPAIFNREVMRVVQGVDNTVSFFDDVMVGSSAAAHETILRTLLQRFRQAGWKLNPAKSTFGKGEIEALGFQLGKKGLSVIEQRTVAVTEMHPPTDVKSLQRFLGMVIFYRRFIQGFADIAAPLYALLKKEAVWSWGEPQQEAFRRLKTALTSAPVLAPPSRERPFKVYTDASLVALGAILAQEDENGVEHPISFNSRLCKGPEKKYGITELECLAVVWALKQYRHYLWGKPFVVYTDHRALKWLLTMKDPSSRLTRWAVQLQQYDFTVEYRRGTQHGNVDCLSRPVEAPEHIRAAALTRRQTREQAAATDSAEKQGEAPVANLETAVEPGEVVVEETLIDNEIDGEEQDQAIEQSQHDPVEDAALLYFLRHKRHRPGESNVTVKRVKKLASAFSWDETTQRLLREGKWVPPVDLRRGLVLRAHRLGHFQESSTLDRLKAEVWFPKMTVMVHDVVKTCVDCLRTRSDVHPVHAPAKSLPIVRVMDRVGMDLVFGLPETKRGHVGLLVLTEYLTKYPFVYPIRSKTASEIARHLFHYMSIMGPPSTILSDNGKEFCNEVVKELCRLQGVERALTSPYKPNTNGLTERFNATLVQALRTHAVGDAESWDLYLDAVLLAYRTRVQSTTGHSPYELLFGRQPHTFMTLFPEDLQPIATPELDVKELAALEQRIVDIRSFHETTINETLKEIVARQEKQRKQQDDSHNVDGDRLPVGTKVMVKLERLVRGSKMAPKFLGPYTVARSNGNTTSTTYVLKTAQGKELKRAVPREKLKVVPDDTLDGSEIFMVDKIIDSRKRNGVMEYLVKWEGYSDLENTWEAEQNFFSLDMIEEYWRSKTAAQVDADVGTTSL